MKNPREKKLCLRRVIPWRQADWLSVEVGGSYGVYAGDFLSVDGPQVEPRSGGGDDVSGQLVHGCSGHGTRVTVQRLDVNVPAQVPDDGRPVAGPRHGHLPPR